MRFLGQTEILALDVIGGGGNIVNSSTVQEVNMLHSEIFSFQIKF